MTHVWVFQRKNSICHHPPHSHGGIFAFMPVQAVPRIKSLPPPFNLPPLKSKKPLLLALETAVPTFCYLYGFASKLRWIMSSPPHKGSCMLAANVELLGKNHWHGFAI